jgi:hypothetical protein
MADSADLTYVVSLEEVTWGLALIGVTMIVHAVAMPTTLAACGASRRQGLASGSFFGGVRVLLLGSAMIATTHLLEVIVWAGFFYLRDAFPTASSAYYYSLLQYTTVGSDLSLPDRWRLLGGMIAMAGLLTFAWSTAVLLTLASRFQAERVNRIETELRSRERAGRRAP